MATLRIIPLGGLGEVGKNMICLEYGRNILIIDAGIMFPESDMPGVDYIIPDWNYLRSKKDHIRAIVMSHGHEDHVGALPQFLQEFNVPVYATRLTRGLIEVKLRQRRMLDQVTLYTWVPGDAVKIGPFVVEPYHVSHSIPDAVGMGITTRAGLLVYSGDFKFDHTPVDGWPTDYGKLAEFSVRGVWALLADSTNADRPGATPSESILYEGFRRIMDQAPGRVIVATFASLISRIQQVAEVAIQYGRKIAIAGRSMVENTQIARDLGYLQIPDEALVRLDQLERLPDEQVLILTTGAQGEPMAVLSRLANRQHDLLQLKKGDTVVISSHTIPGNEEMIYGVINRLFQQDVQVYYDSVLPIHVSGHASQEELKWLISLLRPRFFVPVHGEIRHLKQHAQLARLLGIPDQNIALLENGSVLVLSENQMRLEERIPGGYVFVDGTLVGEVGPRVIRERELLSENGFVTAIVRYQPETGRIVGQPRIITSGFVFVPGAEELLSRAQAVIIETMSIKPRMAIEQVEAQIEQALSRFFWRETGRSPVVTVAAVEI